ncbi:MAG: 50S ribosomal protein L11 methyltransferase [Anaerolineae bacterium]|jgi:ribosomal protein L11 methyltransferase|nr:50S ribosomal protein L11 methyltransferase [Anaerolineae bacterium]MDH7473253.1 50S ribosomal protein L11 methyltransferase [Anaerolineae bacterium]
MNELRWWEISVQVDGEAAEAVCELFNRYGQGGAVVEQIVDGADEETPVALTAVVKAYLPVTRQGRESRQRLEEGLWHLSQLYPIPSPQIRELGQADWATAWREQFTVLHIGRRLVVKPTWLSYSPSAGEALIELDPGMAFGTGLHPTTRQCLLALEEHLRPGMSVLDLGCGSGILAIAAAKLGAGTVLALDTDPTAVEVAQANVSANAVQERVIVAHGSLPEVQDTFDLVLVNILARVIIDLISQGLIDCLKPGGIIVTAGFIEEQAAEVEAALRGQGIAIVDRLVERDWVSLVGQKE